MNFQKIGADGSYAVSDIIYELSSRYPFIETGEIGRSVTGRPLWVLRLGGGGRKLIYSAAHHANEWITAPLLLKFAEELAEAYSSGGKIRGVDATDALGASTLYIIPAVNPDGIDLVTGCLPAGEYYDGAVKIAANYPRINFPSGWKANILGTDLNLQYPAGWETAKAIKYAKGFTSPAPRDFVGGSPLSAQESAALAAFTEAVSPDLILAYHTQGEVIYWRYGDRNPPGAAELAAEFSRLSGYPAEDTPSESANAGYKDWFIDKFNRPGFTIEAGLGESPLPMSQFEKIYSDNLGILISGMVLT